MIGTQKGNASPDASNNYLNGCSIFFLVCPQIDVEDYSYWELPTKYYTELKEYSKLSAESFMIVDQNFACPATKPVVVYYNKLLVAFKAYAGMKLGGSPMYVFNCCYTHVDSNK